MIVGIAGPKRSGKTTLADALSTAFGIEHLSFAAPIRSFVAGLVGCTVDQLEHVKERPVEWLDGVTPRHMMQTLGTEWGRKHVHADLWVRRVLRVASLLAGGAVISDVRFVNEAQAIRALGGVVIRLSRPNTGGSGDAHESETPLPDRLVDFEIANDSSPEAMASVAVILVAPHFRICRDGAAA